MLRLFLRYGYAPAFFLGFVGAAIATIHYGAPPWTLWLLLLLAAIAVSFAAERALPYEPAWNVDHGDGRTNLAHAVVNKLSIFLSVLVMPLLAAGLPGLHVWPRHWPLPLPLQLALAIPISDLEITLVHLASHRFRWL